MSEKAPNPFLKMGLELGPILVFFLAYRWAPVEPGADETARQLSQILFATAIFVPVILASLGLSWALTRELPRMAVLTAVVVTVFGGLTLWLRDGTFIMMKPTILYLAFAGILGFGLMRGRSYLGYLMSDAVPLRPEGWIIFTRRIAVFFLALALANEVVWRGFGADVWVNYKTFAVPLLSIGFIMTQMRVFAAHAPETDGNAD